MQSATTKKVRNPHALADRIILYACHVMSYTQIMSSYHMQVTKPKRKAQAKTKPKPKRTKHKAKPKVKRWGHNFTGGMAPSAILAARAAKRSIHDADYPR